MSSLDSGVRKRFVITFSLLLLCVLMDDGSATDKRFWFGIYNVGPYAEYFNELSSRFKMNWVHAGINDANALQALKNAGLQVMSAPYRYIEYPKLDPTFNRVGVYSDECWMRMEAEGDTIAYHWNPDDETMFVRTVGGRAVDDGGASGGRAWFFDQTEDDSGSVAIWHHRDFTSDNAMRIDLRCRISAEASSSTDPLAYLYIRSWKDGQILASREILRSEFSTSGFQEFPLQISVDTSVAPWHTDIVLEWAGTADLFVDWIGYDSPPDGYNLGNGLIDHEVRGFIQNYGFLGDSTVLGFYMAEEIWSDGNVYPQKRVDSLIKSVWPNQRGWTEHHYLGWWDSRNQFGQRSAISARLQREKHITTINYPMTGYNPRVSVLTDSGVIAMAQMACMANPPGNCADIGSDTSICFQVMMDSAGEFFRFHRRFSDSLQEQLQIDCEFVPFLQAYSDVTRSAPTDCESDTSWYVDRREPTEAETKCHAGIALANGATGLLYYKHASAIKSNLIKLECHEDTVEFVTRRYLGLDSLLEVQSALEDYIGPFVDSLGSYFVDFEWLGGGRLDASRDSAGIAELFDSTARSLTFTTAGDSAFIEAGVYQSDSAQYFLLVNRRAYDTIPQEILTWLNPADDQPLYYIIDLYSRDTVLAGGMGASSGELMPFRASINPGEFKLFKVVSAGISSVTGNSFPKTWIGRIPISSDVRIDSARSLTILGPSQVLINGGGGYTLTSYGNLTIKGSPELRVTMRHNSANPYRWAWNGVRHMGPGNLTWEYVTLQHAYKGLWLNDASVSVEPSIKHCTFTENYLAGIWVDADTLSTVKIQNSHFRDMTYNGVQIFKGFATVDTCDFRGEMSNCVRIEGSSIRSGGVFVRNCTFDSLESNHAAAIYYQYVKSDLISWFFGQPAIVGNSFGTQWDHPSTQSAIYVNNCSDTLVFRKNEISSNGAGGYLSFGIFNLSSPTRFRGDLSDEEERSCVFSTIYGLYCASASASDPDIPQVKECCFSSNYYNVYLPNYGRADLGLKVDDPGANAFHGYMDSCGCGIGVGDLLNVKNNSGAQVKAVGNFWGDSLCSCWPYVVGGVDFSNWVANPFGDGGLPKVSAPVVVTEPDREHPSLSAHCYPNPSNASIVIQLGLDQTGPVRVVLYNVLGQRICSIWDGVLSEGSHQLTWDGFDDRGQQVPSGVYFYRIISGDRQMTKKLALVK